ncbi:MAG: hypothetical protein ACQESD_00090 [Thermoplasmatota archaeon]
MPIRRIEVEAKQEYGGWVQDIDASDMYWDMIFDSDDVTMKNNEGWYIVKDTTFDDFFVSLTSSGGHP